MITIKHKQFIYDIYKLSIPSNKNDKYRQIIDSTTNRVQTRAILWTKLCQYTWKITESGQIPKKQIWKSDPKVKLKHLHK